MKHLFILLPLFTLLACTSGKVKDRSPASVILEQDYTLLGTVNHVGVGKRATRVYLKPISDDSESFWVMVLEYKKLAKVGVNYLLSNKVPWVSKNITGFLNQINQRAVLYKAVPSDTLNTYDLKIVEVDGEQLVTREADRYSQLIFADTNQENILEGARITASPAGEPSNIYLPREGEKGRFGGQYKLAKLTYESRELKSTWRNDFLQGPYLGAYADVEDEVLRLVGGRDVIDGEAVFTINQDRADMRISKREKQFTNPKSAHIQGKFRTKRLADGIFSFYYVSEVDAEKETKGVEHVVGRPAMFVDIFDATESLNQDVVELILTNPDDADDFLMYYEHPENGEGRL